MKYTSLSEPYGDGDYAHRARIARAADFCLRARVPRRAVSRVCRLVLGRQSAGLAAKLVALARDPFTCYNEQAFMWALNYGGPALLRRLIRSASCGDPDRWTLNLVAAGRPRLLLPRERWNPSFQAIQNNRETPASALICVCGNGLKLNLPVQLFHFAVADRFDILVYLRDTRRTEYSSGLPGLGSTMDAVSAHLADWIPPGCQTAVLGTSGGCLAAVRLAHNLHAARMALFSPPKISRASAHLGDPDLTRINASRVFFARRHATDNERAQEWRYVPGVPPIEWLDTDSHGTLSRLAALGRLPDLVDWLATGRYVRIGDTNVAPQVRAVSAAGAAGTY